MLGAGAREHALAWRIAQSRSVSAVGIAPGNDLAALDHDTLPCLLNDPQAVCAAVREYRADFVVVGPEVPLVSGAVDALMRAGVPVLGPTQNAAELEGSKAFAKEAMRRAGVPTAEYDAFVDVASARRYVRERGGALVVKADGLMAGKGVSVCSTTAEAERAVEELFASGPSRVVIERRLPGPELSLIALCDGEHFSLFALSRDYKRVGTYDEGKNTGGMGALCPLPRKDAAALGELTIAPMLHYMRGQGMPFRGFLYAGVMFDGANPHVLEYNVRLGDPETQVLLMAMEDDIVPSLFGAAQGKLEPLPRVCGAAVCVVLAAKGYPDTPELGARIVGVAGARKHPHVRVFGAGIKREGSGMVVSGGRVLSVVAHAATVGEARARAYAAADEIHFEGMQRREDIAEGVGF